MLRVTVLLLALAVGLSSASGPFGGFFPPDNILECFVPNPRAGERDQPDTKPEPVPVIPFRIVYDDINGAYFRPVPSHQGVPPVTHEFTAPLIQSLINSAGSEINFQFSSIPEPNVGTDTHAGGVIPQQYLLEGDGIGPIVETLQNRTAEVEATLDDLNVQDPVLRAAVLRAQMFLNQRCLVESNWVQLQPFGRFFPPWMRASFCPIANCSLPLGLGCEPVVKKEAIAHTLFLMWDCCFSLVDGRWKYECGWRKVRLAYLSQCACSCTPIYVETLNDGSQYINRVGVAQPSRP